MQGFKSALADGDVPGGYRFDMIKPEPPSGGGVHIKGPVIEEIIEETIDNIKIINGKVGGKIPIDEFKAIRKFSIKNPEADSMTLGRYTKGPDSYIARAGKDSSCFDLGEEWSRIQQQYDLSDREMFDYFNKPALDDAISAKKTITFSHDPRAYDTGFLVDEWEYIKRTLHLADVDLKSAGGIWYVQ
jgi:hypothetical protein